MFIPIRHDWRDRKLEEEEERARLKRIYTRNLILIILSLGAAITIFIFTRLYLPQQKHPQSILLEEALHKAFPQDSFSVSIDESGNLPDIEISAVVATAPLDIDAYIAHIEKVIYDDAEFDRGMVVIRLLERLQANNGTELASLAVRRTSLTEIEKNAER